jgi:RNA polymerase sigma-70 factor (sigma-E family)
VRALSVVERSAGGETPRWEADQALTELYAAHWVSLVRLSWLLVRDQHVAEESVQDAFVSMHAHWSRLRDPERALAYLRRSVVNTSRSVLRHRTVENRYLVSETTARTAHGVTTEPSAEERAVARAAGDGLIQALGRLPRRQREVLTLRYYADLSEAQIADALGISAGAVKAHAHRALAALRLDGEISS